MEHISISPAILYWGTPVVLITTSNEANAASPANIAPMSSVWWLGHRCMIGLDASSATTQNLLRTRQCVLNLPSDDMGNAVNAVARTTGTPIVPPSKVTRGYRYDPDKFATASLTAVPSSLVEAPRIQECPVAMECEVMKVHSFIEDDMQRAGAIVAIECRVMKTWIHEELKMEGYENRVDSDKWRPMIMSFQDLYGLSGKRSERASVLAKIGEENYRILAENVGDFPIGKVKTTFLGEKEE